MFEQYRAYGLDGITLPPLPGTADEPYPDGLAAKPCNAPHGGPIEQQHPTRLKQGPAVTYQPPPGQPMYGPPPGSGPIPQYSPGPTAPPFRPPPAHWYDQWWFTPSLIALGVIVGLFSLGQMGLGSSGIILLAILAIPAVLIALLIRAMIRVGDKRPPPVVVNQAAVASPPPGWYPDRQGIRRWFDGQAWTEFTQ